MANAQKCIDTVLWDKEKLRKRLNDYIETEIKSLGIEGDFEARAAIVELTEKARGAALDKKLRDIKHFYKQKEIEGQITNHPAGPGWGAYATIETDPYLAANKNSNYMTSKNVFEGLLMRAAGDDWAQLRSKWTNSVKTFFTDSRRKELNDALINHFSGKGTADNFAKRIAGGWDRMTKEVVKQVRAGGGTLAELKNYKPQPLTQEKLFTRDLLGNVKSTIPEAEFLDDFTKSVDRTVPNPLTGKHWTQQELEKAGKDYYETLLTDGANKSRPNFGKGGLEVAHSINRVFHYTDEGWGRMMKKYGPNDLVSELFNYVDRAASDLGELYTWGPRPAAQREFIMAKLKQQGEAEAARRYDELWKIASGANHAGDAGSKNLLVQMAPATRYAAMTVQLGRAVFASLFGDPAKVFVRSIYNDASMSKYLGSFFRAVQNGEAGYKEALDQLHIWEANHMQLSAALKRMGETNWSGNWVGNRATKVLNVTGLEHITTAARRGSQEMLERNLLSNTGKTFSEIEKSSPDLAVKMREWGLDAVWEDIRGKTKTVDGKLFFDYDKLFDTKRNAAVKLKSYVVGEARNSIITSNVHGDRLMQLHLDSGTTAGEGVRMFAQYLRFSAASYYGFWKPLLQGNGTRGITRSAVALTAMTAPFIAGIMQLWVNDISNGRTPEWIMTPDGEINHKLIARAAFTQDIVPFLGMVFLKLMGWDNPMKWGEQSFISNVADALTVASPGLSFAKQVGKDLVWDPSVALYEGLVNDDWDSLRKEISEGIKTTTDVAGSFLGLRTWQTGYMFGRLVSDQAQKVVAPEAYEQRIERQRNTMEKKGQDYLFLAP